MHLQVQYRKLEIPTKTLLAQTTGTPISREKAKLVRIRRQFTNIHLESVITPLVRNSSVQSCSSTLDEPKRANSPWQKRRSSHSQIPKARPRCHRGSRASCGLIVMLSRSSARKPSLQPCKPPVRVQARRREIRHKSMR